MERRRRLFVLSRPFAVFAFLALGLSARAEVLMSETAALDRAFPGAKVERRVVYLTEAQVDAVQKAARSKMPSPVVTVFEAKSADGASVGRAILDTHVVRTMPESLLSVLSTDGTLRMALVLRFGEPPDYLPRERWLATLQGSRLDDALWPGRGVRRVSGATLTVQALTEAVRRALAINSVVLAETRR